MQCESTGEGFGALYAAPNPISSEQNMFKPMQCIISQVYTYVSWIMGEWFMHH